MCPGRGLSNVVTFDRPDPTLANETRVSSAVVIATVGSIGDAVWNTPDGVHEPIGATWPLGLAIYTPVNLVSARSAFGGAPQRVLFLGGTIGCNRMTVEGSALPAEGDRVALFLAPSQDDRGVRDANQLSAFAAWPLDAAGDVETPTEGTLPLATFEASVEKIAASIGG